MNPLQRLREAGQGVWLDFLRRGLVTGGGLERLLREDHLSGVTSNPTIFGKAIAGSTDYDEAIRELAEKGLRSPLEIFYDLALADIQVAADVLRPLYEETEGVEGFVSFELEPRLAHDMAGSVEAGRELFERLGKPNVMIKVPGTAAGVEAVEELIAAGVNVNITLLFSVERYEEVARAYLTGLERRMTAGEPVDRVASVASFFISRVDSAVDDQLPEGSLLQGKAAVANAKMVYRRFRRLFSGERWDRLAAAGARVQRPLWASTGTKNPAYSDVLYVEELAGPDTVNTIPAATLDAFRDHGRVRPRAIGEGVEEAEATLALLSEHGIDLNQITAGLVEPGIASFDADFTKLLTTIEEKLAAAGVPRPRLRASLGELESRVSERLERMRADGVVTRLWSRDHTLWKPEPDEIANRLGWLTLTDLMVERVPEIRRFVEQVAADGFTRAVVLGMGGSSLGAEVLRHALGVAPGALDLAVLDTTHPAAIAALESSLDLDRTLFVVASKSGGTLETLSHFSYFYDKTRRGEQFVAVTDPGTPLESLARTRGFRAVFLNPSDMVGRYAVLSSFGLVPAALIGSDPEALLDGGQEMACACDRSVPYEDNPGAWLGAVLGEAARAGRDKLTLLLPPELAAFGAWVEQLVSESTGKEGRGIVTVVGEDIGAPNAYGDDRLFVAVDDADVGALEKAGHPVVQLSTGGPGRLGGEFFRWEFATALAGHVLDINPFVQPNVDEAKEEMRRVLESGETEEPGLDDLAAVLGTLRPGDYLALQAYLDPSPATAQALQRARLALRDRNRVATTVGFGPGFLHSTGQLHKGGPPTGVFVQVVDAARDVDLAIPGQPFTFGALIDAQALGDLRLLQRLGRRVARVTIEQLERVVS